MVKIHLKMLVARAAHNLSAHKSTHYCARQLSLTGILLFRGGFHREIYALRFKFALCAHLFCTNLIQLGIMHLRLALNLLHFLPDLGALYAVRPTFMKSTPNLLNK
jgi:hypothetical protein